MIPYLKLCSVCFVLILCRALPAQNFTVEVEGGTFVITGLSVKKSPIGGGGWIKGMMANKTAKHWSPLIFDLTLCNSVGTPLTAHPVRMIPLAKDTRPGDSSELFGDAAADEAKNLKTVDWKKSTLILSSGGHPGNYTFIMIKPVFSEDLQFADSQLKIRFGNDLSFVFRNLTDQPIKIDWDKISVMDFSGTAHRVVHNGTRVVDTSRAQVPTLVPPKAQVEDALITDLPLPGIYVHMGQRMPSDLTKPVGVFMPLEIRGSTVNYMFELKAIRVD
jgi:hypothetical protein